MTEQVIKDFYGRIIGYVEEDKFGNKIVKDFYKRVLGKYDKNLNVTKDFYGRIIGRGDVSVSLIYNSKK